MNAFRTGLTAARRRTAPPHHLGTSAGGRLAAELGWLLGHLLQPSRAVPALIVGLTTAALLAPITPGPVVSAGTRIGLAAAGAALAAVVAHVLLIRMGEEEPSPTTSALVAVASAGMLLGGIVVIAYLLAAIAPTPLEEGQLIGGGLGADRPIALISVLLAGGVLVTGIGDRLRVPGSLALLGLGMVVGRDGLGWVVVDDTLQVQALAVVALVVILYEGGLTTRIETIRGGVAPGVLLATVGVTVTAGVLALVGTTLLGLDTRVALLLAAVVASTDAAVVFAVLRRAPVPRRIAALLQVESGTNDPVAVLLTIGFLSGAELGTTPASWVGFVVAQVGLGAGLGVAIGLSGSWVLRRTHLASTSLTPVLALAVGAAAYGLAAIAGGSGFLAAYVCGITVAARTPGARRTLRTFHEGLATSVEVGLFLLLGLLVTPSQLPAAAGVGLALTAVLLLVARPLAVVVSLGPFPFDRRQLAAVSWLGMRGAVPIVLATVALTSGFDEAGFVLDVVFVVVLVSVLVQGTTAPAVIHRLGLAVEADPRDLAIDSVPFEAADGELVELTLGADSPLTGRELRDVPPPDGVLVTAVIRDGRILVPRGTTRLEADDHLVVVAERPVAGQLRRWAAPTDTRDLTPPT